MAAIAEMLEKANEEGFFDENAEAKVCQDIVLKALSESSLSRNATIKGGVVMRSITKDSFANQVYVTRLARSRKNWINVPVNVVLDEIIKFLDSLG